MRVAFRVDGSERIGTGHVVRCQTLARALKERGATILFVARHMPASMRDGLEKDGCAVVLLPPVETPTKAAGTSYKSWLGVTEEVDAAQTLEILNAYRPDTVVVDHYALGHAWERAIRAIAVQIVTIDDIARVHACDVLLDQNLARAAEQRYEGRLPAGCKLLLGPRYALLQPAYTSVADDSVRTGPVKRIAVFFGGADSGNMTATTLEALSDPQFNAIPVDVVIGATNPNADAVRALAASRPATVVHGARPSLADLFAGADLAIGAGGTTAWERCCCGVPSIVVSIADNQVPGSTALAEAGIVRYLGDQASVDRDALRVCIADTIADESARVEMSQRGRLLVDGRGAQRVAEIIAPTPVTHLALRRAGTQDRGFLYSLANDVMVRAQSFNTAEIPWENHVAWFGAKVSDPNTFLYILTAQGLAVGMIRFDIRGPVATLSYALDAVGRGRKWATVLVERGLQSLAAQWAGDVHAAVKAENIASRLVFEKLAFRLIETGDADHLFVLDGGALRKRFGA